MVVLLVQNDMRMLGEAIADVGISSAGHYGRTSCGSNRSVYMCQIDQALAWMIQSALVCCVAVVGVVLGVSCCFWRLCVSLLVVAIACATELLSLQPVSSLACRGHREEEGE